MSAPLAIAAAGAAGAPATALATRPPTSTAGSSAIDEAHAPAYVRNGSASVKQAYSSAQGFEEMLLQQLSQSMLASSGLGEEGGGSEGGGEEAGGGGAGSSASAGAIGSLLPQALTDGVMREGGLGLAGQLMSSLDPSAASAHGATAITDSSGTGGAALHGGLAASAAVSTPTQGTVASTGGVAS